MATGHQSENPKKLSDEQVQLVRNELESVIASDAFTGSKRCQDFLRLVIDHTLAGDLDELRERMIGVEMFHRPADYDTANDAVVRVRATEVRKRLARTTEKPKLPQESGSTFSPAPTFLNSIGRSRRALTALRRKPRLPKRPPPCLGVRQYFCSLGQSWV